MRERFRTGAALEDIARDVVQDLNRPDPKIYWLDLLGSSALAWTAFAAAALIPNLPGWASAICFALATLGFYRGLCFLHEITHIRPGAVPGFETAWNFLLGVPLLLPSFMYVGVHGDHHKISTYGTDKDPEYLPFARSELITAGFVAHSILIPAFLLARFLVLAPIGFVWPKLREWVAVHASALSMNLRYERAIPEMVLSKVRRWEIIVLLVWGPAFFLGVRGVLSWRALALWYGVNATIALVNTIRTLGAHRYESTGAQMSRGEQLADSIDTPGRFWTELWAPVGLRYHALHHYFPGIPYHKLPEAYRRLTESLPAEATYRQATSDSLLSSLQTLYQTGRSNRREAENVETSLDAAG